MKRSFVKKALAGTMALRYPYPVYPAPQPLRRYRVSNRLHRQHS